LIMIYSKTKDIVKLFKNEKWFSFLVYWFFFRICDKLLFM
jgi:hypothetical protein